MKIGTAAAVGAIGYGKIKTTLLNIDANAKTVKGQKQGYMTAILYLSPWKSAGVNICPMAEMAGCFLGCLDTAGHGGIAKNRATFTPYGIERPDNACQRCRIRRTRLFIEDREAFMVQLHGEITKFIAKAGRKDLTPIVRLNGTSDIRWEQIVFVKDAVSHTIFGHFPQIQFYDYTKICNRKIDDVPNYHLSISYSEASARYAAMSYGAAIEQQRSLVVVFRTGDFPKTFKGRAVINGDENDLRFTDPPNVVVALKAKGKARNDESGFVIDA